MFEVFETARFAKTIQDLDGREKEWISKMRVALAENPFSGKPLGFDWFREKRFEGKRLYFVVSKKKRKVLLVAFGNKKEQRKTIERILVDRDAYFEFLEGKG